MGVSGQSEPNIWSYQIVGVYSHTYTRRKVNPNTTVIQLTWKTTTRITSTGVKLNNIAAPAKEKHVESSTSPLYK